MAVKPRLGVFFLCVFFHPLRSFRRGTLDVAADVTTGGCGSYDDLAERWTTTGFLLGFEVRQRLSQHEINYYPEPT